jgi:hypothetical protein
MGERKQRVVELVFSFERLERLVEKRRRSVQTGGVCGTKVDSSNRKVSQLLDYFERRNV